MGAYLSKPKTGVTSTVFSNERMSCGASAMQGWRVSMEDAHTCVLDFDKNTSLFGVFDGHGGSEVAIYTEKHLGDVLKGTDSYKVGDTKQGLKEAFLKIDEDIVTEEGLLELKEIAGDAGDDSGDENEANMLAQDASIPLKDLLAKLKGDIYKLEKEEAKKHDEDDEDETAANGEGKGDDPENKDEEKELKNGKPGCDDKENPKTKNGDSKNTEEDDSEEDDSEEDDKSDDESEDEAVCDVKDDKHEQPDHEEDNESEDDEEESENDDDDDDDNDGAMDKTDEVGYDSGTTAIVALVKDDLLSVANAGDSRCVLCRNGIALEMSIDHKPEDPKELSRIQKAGGKVNGEGRVNGGLNLSRAIGDHSYKSRTELTAEEQQITALPDIRQTELTGDDAFMVLACDGIWNVMNSQEVVDFVHDELKKQRKEGKVDLSKVCEKLFEACLAPDTSGDGSGCDNMTCVIVTFELSSIKTKKRKIPETELSNPDKKSRTDKE